MQHGVLRLFRGPKEHHARPAINPLFRSAGLDAGPRTIAVILTGMLDDGAAGISAVKACGGTTIAQDPREATAPSMPRAAIATGAVDHVVTLEAMARLLLQISPALSEVNPVEPPSWLRIEHGISLGNGSVEELDSVARPVGYSCPECGGALFEMENNKPVRFLCHTGHAFSLLSLLQAQDSAVEGVMWASIRALQEKAALLRRLADTQEDESRGSGADLLREAAELEQVLVHLRAAQRSVPVASDSGQEDEAALAT